MDFDNVYGTKEDIMRKLSEFENEIQEEEEKKDADVKKINDLRYAQLMKGLYLQLFN